MTRERRWFWIGVCDGVILFCVVMLVIWILLGTARAANVMFSDSQCRVLKQMRVDTRGGCPAHIRATVQVRSPHADEAAYNQTVSSVAMGGTDARGGSGSPDNPSSGPVGGADAGSGIDSGGVGPGDGKPSDGNRPGGGQPGSAPKPPFKPGTVIGQPGKVLDGERIKRLAQIRKTLEGLSPEQKRRLISKIRKEQGGSDFNQPDDKGKAHRGRNSR